MLACSCANVHKNNSSSGSGVGGVDDDDNNNDDFDELTGIVVSQNFVSILHRAGKRANRHAARH